MMRIRNFLAVLGLLLAAFAVPGRAGAIENETFGLLPHPHNVENQERRTFVIPLERGALFEDSIRVYNRTDQPLSLIVYAADAETGVDGTVSVGFRGSQPKGIGAWVDLSKDSMTLPPAGDTLVRFRIEVRSSDPQPDLGAIVVENAERGIATDLAQRLHLVIRTSPPNSPTTSVRVRPLLLRSPWIIIATIGLVVALVIIWLGARRARRPKDAVVPSGDLVQVEEDEATAASRPVLRRLGESEKASPAARRRQGGARANRPARSSSSRTGENADSRPMLDELLAEIEEPEDEAPRSPRRKPAKRQPNRSQKPRTQRKAKPREQTGEFIPLDEL
ncbi:MAG TPA: hypothetical protein VFA34_06605 [Actinomycetota bacterium]|jgi:hypothetical protein|nr:hypothetical protein [Actinomycetota bacterium]